MSANRDSHGTVQVFTIHNADCDVLALLESVRGVISDLGAVDVWDMTFSAHFDGPDYVAEMSVYFSYKKAQSP
jgi:hypothetical protein